ncbi:zinc-dependent alcohol dehydrogenase [Sinosporangium siamense]|uniref:Alcohol dehydrogenase n=1 Tax=Sinosporangium siamense TaxID=1367973 RepID=A0A919RA40_9ACTN|nr:alcohol dehydrogenase catalytic domain-containing protein [Sinosporangium siamense]GII90133.1 alcohol dehydrogenase [Sinosporangium siamense]
MRALIYRAPWHIEIADRPVPAPTRPTECLVRVETCGICGTDIGIITGDYGASRPPVVLGHEAAGEVVQTGAAVRTIRVGDRVAINPTFFCGSCRLCRTGRTNHCALKEGTEAGVSSDGALAEYFRTHERFLHRLPPHVSYEEAALTEPLSCVLTGAGRLTLRPSAVALVLGLGPIGVLYALVLALRGVRGIAIEPAAARRMRAEPLLRAEGWTVRENVHEVRRELNGVGIDVLVDAGGCFDNSFMPLLAPGAQVLLVALRTHRQTIDLGSLADRSISLVGSIDTLGTFDDALSLLASARIPAKDLISHLVPLPDLPGALQLLGCDIRDRSYMPRAAALKVVAKPGVA